MKLVFAAPKIFFSVAWAVQLVSAATALPAHRVITNTAASVFITSLRVRLT
jgi:hypothetical protein